MGFFHKILGRKSTKETQVKRLKEIGEVDCCPYCNEKLEKIPTRKSKCPHCSKFMYSRTRPLDRKKVLVTKKQKDEIELEWERFQEANEEVELMQNDEFAIAKKELTKQFGKEPTLNDIKWRVYNQRILEFASQKQWGLYRNNKLNMANLLQNENKIKPALSTLFEVAYLDVNGCNNVGEGLSKEEMNDYGIKEFDPKSAFMAPGVIGSIQDLIIELELSERQAKDMLISINKKMKPVKNMPISEEKAWEKVIKEINIRKANESKIKEFDAEDIAVVIKEIREAVKTKNTDTLPSIIYKFRDQHRTKKMIVPNAKKIKKVLEELLYSSELTRDLGVSLLIFFTKKDKEIFEPLIKDYIKRNEKKLKENPNDSIIGELSKIDPSWIEFLIPGMIKALKQNPEWNTRRFVAFNLGNTGSKHPNLVKESIPIMIDYIKSPSEVSIRKPIKVEAEGVAIEMDLSPEKILGVDQTQWLKDAYIDSLGMIAKGDKHLIEPYKALFEKIAKKDKSEYSRKKAQAVLDILVN